MELGLLLGVALWPGMGTALGDELGATLGTAEGEELGTELGTALGDELGATVELGLMPVRARRPRAVEAPCNEQGTQ